jgi:uncharacterized membrane protein HdeD (DUF308 family)
MATLPLLEAFARNWWVWLIRGILAVLFGIMSITMSGLTLRTLLLLYGVYALADGLMGLWAGGQTRSWWLVIPGVLGIIAGFCTFIYPDITAVGLLYLIAAWAILRGIFEIITSIQLYKEIGKGWALIAGGMISVIVGVVLFANPGAGALAMVWVIAAYALFFGLMMILLAFRLRGLLGRLEKLA